MRALVLVFVAVAGAGCEDDGAPPPAAARPTVPSAAVAQKQRDDCRDACEQAAIVSQAKLDDAALRTCRARCDARLGAPHEVPHSITRAAPVHAPPAVRPR